MTRTEHERSVLSDWRFWVGVAYFGIAATVVGLFILFNRTAREEATRAATAKSAAITQVGQCFTAVKNGPVTKGFIAANAAVIENQILANQAAILTQPGSALTRIREQSLVRLQRAKANSEALSRLLDKAIPTRKKCVRLARMLHVDASRYTKQQR